MDILLQAPKTGASPVGIGLLEAVPLAAVALADVLLAAVLLADGLLLASTPKTPPLTEAVSVLAFAFFAAALYASRVFGPVGLSKVNTVLWLSLNAGLVYSRRINDSNHTGLAMSTLSTVIP